MFGLFKNKKYKPTVFPEDKELDLIKFEAKKHIEFDEDAQGINITEFTFDFVGDKENERIIDQFIHSKSFTYDSLSDFKKNNPDMHCLRQAFDSVKISSNDFKKYNKEEINLYLHDFIDDDCDPDYKKEFANLIKQYLDIQKDYPNAEFYIINKDWFKEGDLKVIEPENLVYTYYFLIIWIDSKSKTFGIAEWTWD